MPSDENVIQSSCTPVPFLGTVDRLPSCWSPWTVKNPNLQGKLFSFLGLDKKSVDDKELEKAKNEVHDHRNLYLAKVCFLLCNSCGAGC